MQLHLPLFHPHLYTTTRHNNHELQHTLLLLRIPHKPPNQKHNGRPLRRRPVSRTTPPPQTTPPTNTPPPSDLLRRLPPSATAQNLAGIISLVPSLEEELLSSVDVGLTAKRCPASGRDYLCCDYNRDGDSYRSPWSNDFDPQIDPEDAADLIPRDADDKRLPFAQATPGGSGLATLLGVTLAQVHGNGLPLLHALALLTSRPARVLGSDAGRLAKGAPADLCLFDLERAWKVESGRLPGKAQNTPFDGRARAARRPCAGMRALADRRHGARRNGRRLRRRRRQPDGHVRGGRPRLAVPDRR